MKILFFSLPACIVFLLIGFNATAQNNVIKKETHSPDLQNLPLIFRKNAGQWDSQILYKGTSPKGDIFFMDKGLVFTHSRNNSSKADNSLELEYITWKLSFEGMSDEVVIEANGQQASRTNYLLGNKAAEYKYNIPDYNQINYLNIYPETDLRYYGSGKNLKYDYILKPGGNIENIRMKCEGIEQVTINTEGELELKHEWGVIKENKPYSYQIINGIQKEIDVRFALINEKTFGFKIFGEYDQSKNLIIDPVTLIWGTYVGGNSPSNGGYLYDLTTDAAGNIYATGYYPNTFPATSAAYDKTFNGGYGDVFVFKLDASGSFLHYATYIGGNDDDRGNSIAVNQVTGEAFITGYTASASTSFPNSASFGSQLAGHNVFVCKLSADGSALNYSTYIGGLNHDIGNGIQVDNSNNAYVVGETQSTNFPVAGSPYDASYNGGSSDAFLFKLSPSGGLLYSTFIGGAGDDRGKALAIGPNESIFLTGQSSSTNFPTTVNAFDRTHNGDFDAFISKVNTNTGLLYSTFIGGIAGDEGTSIDINAAGDAFITGYSFSPDYPITVPGALKGLRDVIATRLDHTGSSLMYSRFIGGALRDEGTSIIINTKDQAFIAGTTESTDFPLVLNGINDPNPLKDKEDQVFVLMLNETGSVIKKSIKLGGSFDDYKIPSLSFPDKNMICDVVIGFTSHSPDLQTTKDAYQINKQNGNEANDQPAVFKLYVGPDSIPAYLPDSMVVCLGDVLTFDATCSLDPDYPCSFEWTQGILLPDSSFTPVRTLGKDSHISIVMDSSFLTYCYVRLIRNNGCEMKTEYMKVLFPDSFTIHPDLLLCAGKTIHVSGGPVLHTYLWSTGATSSSIMISSPGSYWVTSTDRCGNSMTDTFNVFLVDKPIVNLGPDKSFCFPGTYTLDALNPTDSIFPRSYKWSLNSLSSSSIIINEGGTYSVDVTNMCGTTRDEILITALKAPIVNLGNDTSMCHNSTIVLDAENPGLPKIWSTGATTQTLSVSTPGIYWVDVTDVCGTTRDSILIENSTEIPVVDLGPDQTLCTAFSRTLNATNSGANYYWSTGETTPTITLTSGGTYHVLVTNGCGTDQDTITFIAPPSASLELGPDRSVCSPQTLTLTAGNPGGTVNYLWSNGATTPSITVGNSGNYSVQVSNVCGSASDLVNVLVQTSPPAAILEDTLICPDTDVELDAKNPGGSYWWSTGATTSTLVINIAARDTFWVDISNSCGTIRDSILLDLASPPVYTLGADTSICAPASIVLNAGNPGATYVWSTGATSQNISVHSTGIYYVDITRCQTIRDSIRITANGNVPVVNLGNDTTICTAFTKTLDAGINPGASYLWSPHGETTRTIQVSVGKLYVATVRNGCGASTDSINIIGQPYLNLGPDVAICEYDTIQLDAGNLASKAKYLWSTNDTTQTIQVHTSGTYTVDISNHCGSLTDEILVSLDILPCIVELGPDQRICAPANVILDAENDGSKYLWSTGETTRTIAATASGLYKVEVTNGCGVTPDSIFILVDDALPSVDLGPDRELCRPVNVVLNAGNANADFTWYPGGQTTQTIRALAGGTYSVKVANACGSDSTGMVIHEFSDPVVDLGADQKICIQAPLHPTTSPVVLNAGHPGAQYFWTPGGETSQTINVIKTGTYTVNASNVCGIFSDKVHVIIDTLAPLVELGPDDTICSPAGYVLDAGDHPGASIVWTPNGQTSGTLTVTTEGTYSVSVTNQCNTSKDTIYIAPNPVIVNAKPDAAICFPNTIQLSTFEDASYTYHWSPSESLNDNTIYNPQAFPAHNTDYIVLVDDGICSNLDTARVVVHPVLNPQIFAWPLDGYVPLTVNFSNISSSPAHTWFFGDGTTSNAANPVHTFNQEALYDVILMTTSQEGCIEYDTIRITAFSLFIPNLVTPNGDGENDRWDLTNLHININVEIYNRWGDLIYKKDGYIDDWTGEGESDGVYYFYINDAKYNKSFKGWIHLVRSTH